VTRQQIAKQLPQLVGGAVKAFGNIGRLIVSNAPRASAGYNPTP
jgi:hypothetical protein